MRPFFKSFIAIAVAVETFFASLFGMIRTGDPTYGRKQIDLSDFTMVWNDEFDGDRLDTGKWGYEWWVTMRKGGYWHEDMVSVENGDLVIRAAYKEEGMPFKYGEYADWMDPYQPGFYTGQVITRDKYEQCYGYFETRCILPAGCGLWSAFWLMNEGVFHEDGSGRDGTEIDVFESFFYNEYDRGNDRVSINLHFDGYQDAHQREHIANAYIQNDPYKEYNTYGVEWSPDAYIFYINGKEVGRSTFGGVSQEPEYLLLSVEFSGENGVPSYDARSGAGDIRQTPEENWPCEFRVDYVRCYQYNSILAQQ